MSIRVRSSQLRSTFWFDLQSFYVYSPINEIMVLCCLKEYVAKSWLCIFLVQIERYPSSSIHQNTRHCETCIISSRFRRTLLYPSPSPSFLHPAPSYLYPYSCSGAGVYVHRADWNNKLKGTINITFHLQRSMSNSHRYPLNLYLNHF